MRILAEFEVAEPTFWQFVARTVPQLSRIAMSPPAPEATREEETPTDRWMRVADAAKYASVSRTLLYEACASGRLKCARVGIGGAIRVRKPWIDEWMTRQ